jgi:hypothetical protein
LKEPVFRHDQKQLDSTPELRIQCKSDEAISVNASDYSRDCIQSSGLTNRVHDDAPAHCKTDTQCLKQLGLSHDWKKVQAVLQEDSESIVACRADSVERPALPAAPATPVNEHVSKQSDYRKTVIQEEAKKIVIQEEREETVLQEESEGNTACSAPSFEHAALPSALVWQPPQSTDIAPELAVKGTTDEARVVHASDSDRGYMKTGGVLHRVPSDISLNFDSKTNEFIFKQPGIRHDQKRAEALTHEGSEGNEACRSAPFETLRALFEQSALPSALASQPVQANDSAPELQVKFGSDEATDVKASDSTRDCQQTSGVPHSVHDGAPFHCNKNEHTLKQLDFRHDQKRPEVVLYQDAERACRAASLAHSSLPSAVQSEPPPRNGNAPELQLKFRSDEATDVEASDSIRDCQQTSGVPHRVHDGEPSHCSKKRAHLKAARFQT